MSKAGCPYDNAPMERFYNTLKLDMLGNFFKQSVTKMLDHYIRRRSTRYSGLRTPAGHGATA